MEIITRFNVDDIIISKSELNGFYVGRKYKIFYVQVSISDMKFHEHYGVAELPDQMRTFGVNSDSLVWNELEKIN